jgi:hypothetical protein
MAKKKLRKGPTKRPSSKKRRVKAPQVGNKDARGNTSRAKENV